MTVFYEEGVTESLYHNVDVMFGLSSFLLFLSSTPLNLVVMGFYLHKKQSNSAKLYVLLGLMNLLGTLVHPCVMSYNFLSHAPPQDKDLPLALLLFSCSVATLGINCGGAILTLISCLRLYILKYPLRRVSTRKHIIFTTIALTVALLMVVLMFLESKTTDGFSFYFNNKKQFIADPELGTVKVSSILVRTLFFGNLFLCILVCGLTGYVICPRRAGNKIAGSVDTRKRRSTMTIFYMNLIYTITLIYMVVVVVLVFSADASVTRQVYFQVLSFVAYPLLPLLLSLSNPLVMLCRGNDMRVFVRQMLVCSRPVPNSAPSSVLQHPSTATGSGPPDLLLRAKEQNRLSNSQNRLSNSQNRISWQSGQDK